MQLQRISGEYVIDPVTGDVSTAPTYGGDAWMQLSKSAGQWLLIYLVISALLKQKRN